MVASACWRRKTWKRTFFASRTDLFVVAVKNMQHGKLRQMESNVRRCKGGELAAMKGLKV